MAHPYYVTPAAEQHESARERMAREAREFIAHKAELARKLAGHKLIAVPAHA